MSATLKVHNGDATQGRTGRRSRLVSNTAGIMAKNNEEKVPERALRSNLNHFRNHKECHNLNSYFCQCPLVAKASLRRKQKESPK